MAGICTDGASAYLIRIRNILDIKVFIVFTCFGLGTIMC